MRVLSIWYGGPSSSAMCGGGEFSIAVSPTRNVEGGQLMFFLFATVDANKKPPESQGFKWFFSMELLSRFELETSSLPRMRSTN